jgi:hypothetical protein
MAATRPGIRITAHELGGNTFRRHEKTKSSSTTSFMAAFKAANKRL